jgi:hypothetical protein
MKTNLGIAANTETALLINILISTRKVIAEDGVVRLLRKSAGDTRVSGRQIKACSYLPARYSPRRSHHQRFRQICILQRLSKWL